MIDIILKGLTLLGVAFGVIWGVYNSGRRSQKKETEAEKMRDLVKIYEDNNKLNKGIRDESKKIDNSSWSDFTSKL